MDDKLKKDINIVAEIIERFSAHQKLYEQQKAKTAEEHRKVPK